MNIFEFIKLNSAEFKVFLEIGAHFGTDTLKFRNLLPESRILIFEPDPRNINIIKSNGIDKICELYELALSDKAGKIDFYLSKGDCKHWCNDSILRDNDWSASNSIKKPKEHLNLHNRVKFDETIKVDSIRLDDFEFLFNEDIIDFIWADVQGAEDLVFTGAKEVLKKTRYVYTEYNNKELYEGQLNLEGILKLFGEDREIVFLYQDDVLLKNKNL